MVEARRLQDVSANLEFRARSAA